MKRILIFLLTLFILQSSYLPVIAADAPIPVTGIRFEESKIAVNQGDRFSVHAVLSPANATNQTIKYTSSNTEKLSIEDGNYVTPIGGGSTIITAESEDGGFVAQLEVVVHVNVTNVQVFVRKQELFIGQEQQLITRIAPADADIQELVFESSDPSIATVDEEGYVLGVGAGTTKILAKQKGNESGESGFVFVKVLKPITKITLNTNHLKMKIDQKKQLDGKILPSDAYVQFLNWRSSDPTVAEVDNRGLVRAVGNGECSIVAYTYDGVYDAGVFVEVHTPVKSIRFESKTQTFHPGESGKMEVLVNPFGAENRDIKWTLSDSKVAKIDENAKLTALKIGTTELTATSVDGNKTATTTINVVPFPKKIVLNTKKASLKVKGTLDLIATVQPAGAIQKVKWLSSNRNIATIDANGTIKAIKPGTVTITATSTDGDVKATCTLVVTK